MKGLTFATIYDEIQFSKRPKKINHQHKWQKMAEKRHHIKWTREKDWKKTELERNKDKIKLNVINDLQSKVDFDCFQFKSSARERERERKCTKNFFIWICSSYTVECTVFAILTDLVNWCHRFNVLICHFFIKFICSLDEIRNTLDDKMKRLPTVHRAYTWEDEKKSIVHCMNNKRKKKIERNRNVH